MPATTLKKIDSAIASFTSNRDKLRDQAHDIAMLVFYHAAPTDVSPDCNGHGDVTRAASLVAAMPKSWADLMVQWFMEFTPIRISSDRTNSGYDKKYGKLSPEDKLKWWKLADANEMPFHTLSKDAGNGATKVLEIADLLKMAAMLGKRIAKIADGEDDKNIIKPEDMETAKAFSNLMLNITFERIKTGEPINSNEPENPNDMSADEKVAA